MLRTKVALILLGVSILVVFVSLAYHVEVAHADGRPPDELNHGIAVYYVDSINEYFSDGNTCAKWINNASELEVVKHPLVMNDTVCADWTYYQVVAGLEPVE